jgi:hypothetical protein
MSIKFQLHDQVAAVCETTYQNSSISGFLQHLGLMQEQNQYDPQSWRAELKSTLPRNFKIMERDGKMYAADDCRFRTCGLLRVKQTI